MFKNKLLCLFIFALFCAGGLKAQPCLNSWQYRVPVNVNSTSALTDLQIVIENLNTSTLIANAKLLITGADLRFLDANGTVLPHWVESGTFNTANTKVWIKVPSISAGNTTIYMFYGNTAANFIENGAATFEVFDGFTGNSIDGSIWHSCQLNSGNISVAGGNLTLSNVTTPDKAGLVSASTFSSPVRAEMSAVNVSASSKKTYLGLLNGSDNGYSMNYEDNGISTTVVPQNTTSAGASCVGFSSLFAPNNVTRSSGSVNGIWQLSWIAAGVQSFNWPGASNIENITDPTYSLPTDTKVTLGVADRVGTTSIDWIRVRKYTANEPISTVGSEVELVTQASLRTNEALCEGQDLVLTANKIIGASYTWSGPNAFSQITADSFLVISNTTVLQSGGYSVAVSIPAGCATSTASVNATIFPATVAGTLSGATTICATDNSTDVIKISGQTGGIVRWESSASQTGPWITITNTKDSLEYSLLPNSIFFRAVVQSGECTIEETLPIQISVSPETQAGIILGEKTVCSGNNSGQVVIADYVGIIVRWQSSTDGINFADITNSTNQQSYTNLAATTHYRAIIQSGVCDADTTEIASVLVETPPSPGFSNTTACEGNTITFVNTTGSLTDLSFEWDFGDGSSSVNQTPSHIYETAGDYTVKLKAISSIGCANTVQQTLTVNPLPVVAFTQTDICETSVMTLRFKFCILAKIELMKYLFSVLICIIFGQSIAQNQIIPKDEVSRIKFEAIGPIFPTLIFQILYLVKYMIIKYLTR
jgi:hypothetical protein